MRNLALTETQKVTGFGYAEDIAAVAGTLYVANTLSTIGAAAIHPLLTLISAPYAVSPIAMSLSGLVFPLTVAGFVLDANPQFKTVLVEKFHSYFG